MQEIDNIFCHTSGEVKETSLIVVWYDDPWLTPRAYLKIILQYCWNLFSKV